VNDKGNIEDLFKEAFENYEEPVSPELWNRISSQIQAPVSAPQAANLAQGGAASIKAGALWIAGAALVVTTGIAVYMNSGDSEKITSAQQNNEVQIFNNTETTPNAVNETVQNATDNSAATTTSSQKNTTVKPAVNTNNQVSNGASTVSESVINNNQTAATYSNEATNTAQNTATSTPVSAATPKVNGEQPGGDHAAHAPATEMIKDEIKAYPTAGVAPLSVDLSLSGIYDEVSWEVEGSTIAFGQRAVNYTFTESGDYTVKAVVTGKDGKKQELTRKISADVPSFLSTIPNIFTPNGDGLNDIFKVESAKNIDLEAIIYDQKGSVVKQWTGIENGWDGKLSSGQDAAEGTYFYIIFATSSNGAKQQFKSTLTLKR